MSSLNDLIPLSEGFCALRKCRDTPPADLQEVIDRAAEGLIAGSSGFEFLRLVVQAVVARPTKPNVYDPSAFERNNESPDGSYIDQEGHYHEPPCSRH